MMAWVLLAILIGAAIYLYFTGHLKFISTESKQKHEIILTMWLDGLKSMEEKKIYGDETERIVKMMRHGMEQMAFDLCGYEVMVNMDDRQRQVDAPSKMNVRIGDDRPSEEVIEKRVPEKRVQEVFDELCDIRKK